MALDTTLLDLDRVLSRSDKVSGLYEKLFEDHAESKVSEEWFMHMSQKYETDRLELKNKISRLRKELAEADELKLGQKSFANAIRRFLEVQVLTRPLLQELIDHIKDHETEGVGKSRAQRVAAYYRFVGYLEIPDEQTRFSEDTRQGVSVEYISCAPIKVRYGDDGEECVEGG